MGGWEPPDKTVCMQLDWILILAPHVTQATPEILHGHRGRNKPWASLSVARPCPSNFFLMKWATPGRGGGEQQGQLSAAIRETALACFLERSLKNWWWAFGSLATSEAEGLPFCTNTGRFASAGETQKPSRWLCVLLPGPTSWRPSTRFTTTIQIQTSAGTWQKGAPCSRSWEPSIT